MAICRPNLPLSLALSAGRRGNRGFDDFYLHAKAGIWHCLFRMCCIIISHNDRKVLESQLHRSNGFGKSTPPQNCQLLVLMSNGKRLPDDLMEKLTFYNHLINTLVESNWLDEPPHGGFSRPNLLPFLQEYLAHKQIAPPQDPTVALQKP